MLLNDNLYGKITLNAFLNQFLIDNNTRLMRDVKLIKKLEENGIVGEVQVCDFILKMNTQYENTDILNQRFILTKNHRTIFQAISRYKQLVLDRKLFKNDFMLVPLIEFRQKHFPHRDATANYDPVRRNMELANLMCWKLSTYHIKVTHT